MYAVLKQRRTYLYLLLSLIIIIASATFVSPPDSIIDIFFGFTGSILFILSFTHGWDKVKPYLILAGVSLVLFIFSLTLHEIFEGLGFNKGTIINDIRTFLFLLAIFMCPAGIIIGITGSIFQTLKTENR